MLRLSLGTIAKELDKMLDRQMTGQARIAAHLVAAAEAAGNNPEQVIRILDEVVAFTVLDELWITDEKGFAYLTTVRDEEGKLIPFSFNPDPEVQPQASLFYPLLSEAPDSDAVIAQEAQNREIDWEVYKYVGVSGVDKQRIVQVGSALAFEEQGLLTNTYSSPVMTAVLAAFGEYDLLYQRHTTLSPQIQGVFNAMLTKQLAVHCVLTAVFVEIAEAAGWSCKEICQRLGRVVNTSPLDAIHVSTTAGSITHSSKVEVSSELPRLQVCRAAIESGVDLVEHEWELAADNKYKVVTVLHRRTGRLVQVVESFKDTELVALMF